MGAKDSKFKRAMQSDVGAAAGKFTDKYTPTFKKGILGAGKLGASVVRKAKVDVAAQRSNNFFKGLLNQGKNRAGAFLPKSPASYWFILAIIIYLTDIFITKFDGIDITEVLSTFQSISSESIMKIFFNGVVLTLIIAYRILKRPAPSKAEFFAFFALVEMFSLIFSLGGFFNQKGLFHLLFVLFFYVFYIIPNAEDKVEANMTLTFLLFVDFFGFGILKHFLGSALIANRLIIPIWVYFIIITTREKPRWMTFATFFIILINVFAFMNGMLILNYMDSDLTTAQIEQGAEFGIDAWTNMKMAASTFVDPIVCAGKILYAECIVERKIIRSCKLTEDTLEEVNECVLVKKNANQESEIVEELTAIKIEFKELTSEDYKNIAKANSKNEVPMELLIESPIDSTTRVEISCEFLTESGTIPGIITPANAQEIIARGTIDKFIDCEPTLPFPSNGYVKTIFKANLYDVTTISFLERIFAGSAITEPGEKSKKEKAIILNLYHPPLKERQGSRVGEDPLAYSFKIGPTTFISGDEETKKLRGNLENKYQAETKTFSEKGEILNVKKVLIDLRGSGITPNDNCFEDGFKMEQGNLVWEESVLPSQNPELSIACDLTIPQELRMLGPKDTNPIGFKSYLTYDYSYKKQKTLDIITDENFS